MLVIFHSQSTVQEPLKSIPSSSFTRNENEAGCQGSIERDKMECKWTEEL